jgi:hypothetical protein
MLALGGAGRANHQPHSARFQANLRPRQKVQIDSPENKSLDLQCGDNAETLAIVGTSEFIDAGAAQ